MNLETMHCFRVEDLRVTWATGLLKGVGLGLREEMG